MTKESTTTIQAVLNLFRAFSHTSSNRLSMTSQVVYDWLINRQIITEEQPIANVHSSIRQLDERGDIKRLQVSETRRQRHLMNFYLKTSLTSEFSKL